MKEIATISPERLNNGAHYQFMTSVLNYAVADEKIAEETHLKPLVQNLTTALTKEDKDLKISQKGYPVIGQPFHFQSVFQPHKQPLLLLFHSKL